VPEEKESFTIQLVYTEDRAKKSIRPTLYLAVVKCLEILKVSTGRDVHIWVARFGWAKWGLV
jgi:hypothetical protein